MHLKAALDEATVGIEIADGMTTHRLRHTYATTLLNAGMSLMGVMKLLGHRNYRMTLRYTEITLETVGQEYRTALTQLETRYRPDHRGPHQARSRRGARRHHSLGPEASGAEQRSAEARPGPREAAPKNSR